MNNQSNKNNHEYADEFFVNVKDSKKRILLTQNWNSPLENAVAYYEREERRYLNDINFKETGQMLLPALAKVMADKIKNHGPDYYGPEARYEKLAINFTENIKPTLRNQATPTREELLIRIQLITNNGALAHPLIQYQKLEDLLSRDGNLNENDVMNLTVAVEIIGRKIRTLGPESVHFQDDSIKKIPPNSIEP